VEIAPVDPRDSEWEQAHPVYRVYFWAQAQAPPVSAQHQVTAMWRSEEWRLTIADDVHEVLDWANGAAGRGRRFTLYIETDTAEGRGLAHLAGTDPTASAAPSVTASP
jgi:hypothetical protein